VVVSSRTTINLVILGNFWFTSNRNFDHHQTANVCSSTTVIQLLFL